jgi:hypothetical protein
MILVMEDLNVQMTVTWDSDWVVHQLYSAIEQMIVLKQVFKADRYADEYSRVN